MMYMSIYLQNIKKISGSNEFLFLNFFITI
jgi:hypothetical protein